MERYGSAMEPLQNVSDVLRNHCGTLWSIAEALWGVAEHYGTLWSIARHYGDVAKRCGALWLRYGSETEH